MSFFPSSCVPALPFEPPDDIPLLDFVFDEKYGRAPFHESSPLFICGLAGRGWTPIEYRQRIEDAADGLGQLMGWNPNSGSEWSKVACIFGPNTIDYVAAAWSITRLGGVAAPLNAECTVPEVVSHLKMSGSSCMFTCATHLETAREAADLSDIPEDRIFLLEVPQQQTVGKDVPVGFKAFDELVDIGRRSGAGLEKLRFEKGQGARQTAFLCSSSGTSGLPKGVMLSHRNIITNVLQAATYEAPNREWFARRKGVDASSYKEVALALLPFSHAYGLTVVSTVCAYRGDTALVLPKFELRSFLKAIEDFRITTLYTVPPLVIHLKNNKALYDEFDLSSVDSLVCGAAPLRFETNEEITKMWPRWVIRQIYGCTESTALITGPTPVDDLVVGSSGCLLPGMELRILSADGEEVTEYDQPGELVVRSPAVVQGYLNREDATKEAFRDGWLHTGDEAMIRRSETGNEHIWITDRLKEMMKVKGFQVAPAELEAHLLLLPAVADCAVIPVPDDYAGDLPKAFVVKAPGYQTDKASDEALVKDIVDHVKRHKSRHKWLAGGVEFIDVVPKTPSGKIQRRLLKDKERERRRAQATSPSASSKDEGGRSRIYRMATYPLTYLTGYMKPFFGADAKRWSWVKQILSPIWLLALPLVGLARAKATEEIR